MDILQVKDRFSASIEASRGLKSGFLIGTTWDFECYDKDGNLKWEERNRPNIVTNEGLNHLLNVVFHGTTAFSPWYIGAVESNTTAAATMTYATPVFTEWDGYTEAVRQEFVESAASSQSITNSASKATFTSSEAMTLYGGALFSYATMSDTAHAGAVLFCYSLFSSSKPVENLDVFKITLTITASHS